MPQPDKVRHLSVELYGSSKCRPKNSQRDNGSHWRGTNSFHPNAGKWLNGETAGLMRVHQTWRSHAITTLGIGTADDSTNPLQSEFKLFRFGRGRRKKISLRDARFYRDNFESQLADGRGKCSSSPNAAAPAKQQVLVLRGNGQFPVVLILFFVLLRSEFAALPVPLSAAVLGRQCRIRQQTARKAA